MHRLPDSEWLPFAPDEPGTVRVNHSSSDCSGSSKSLKITRTEDDRLYSKCYRCGGFGSSAGRLAAVSSVAKRVAKRTATVGRDVSLPSDFSSNISKMPPNVRAKLHEYKVKQSDMDQYHIGWSKRFQRLIIPVFRGGTTVGWQGRYYGDDLEQPKYITRYKDDGDLWAPTFDLTKVGHVVLVEDFFSAIRVSKYCPAIALLGTEMGDKCLDYVGKSYERALIWTDYDSADVRKKGIKIKDKLTLVGVDASIYIGDTTDPKDPKELSDTEIEEVLDKYGYR